MYLDVLAFHEKFHCPISDGPTLPSARPDKALRKRLLEEEVAEFLHAYEHGSPTELACEGCDVIYIIIGSMIAAGVPLDAVWEKVHAANMQKIPAGPGLKVGKPPNWVSVSKRDETVRAVHEFNMPRTAIDKLNYLTARILGARNATDEIIGDEMTNLVCTGCDDRPKRGLLLLAGITVGLAVGYLAVRVLSGV